MTGFVGVILSMAVGVYVVRLGGLLLSDRAMPVSWERALSFVPVATLTALVVSSLAGRPDEAGLRLTAAVAAGFAAQRSGRPWLCIVAGLTVYWLLRLV